MSQRSSMRYCKFCHSTDVLRIARHGFLQRKVYSLFGFFPWECPHCRRISLLADRGNPPGRYRSASRDRAHHPEPGTPPPVQRSATEN